MLFILANDKFEGIVEATLVNVDEKLTDHGVRITKLERTDVELIKIGTLLEMQFETSKDHALTLKNINSNLTQLTSNLTQLTHTVTSLDNRVVNLEGSVTKINDNSNINWHELVKKTLIMGAVALISVAGVYLFQNIR